MRVLINIHILLISIVLLPSCSVSPIWGDRFGVYEEPEDSSQELIRMATLGLNTNNELLETPTVITGPSTVFYGQSNTTYTTTAVPFATSYTWSVPANATIISGNGTTSIIVSFSCTTVGVVNISVTANNTDSNSMPQTLALTMNNSIIPLLLNGSAQLGTMLNWTILLNGGNGWNPVSGQFQTSFGWDTKSQIIDLVAAGYPASYLDTAPNVFIGEKFYQRSDVAGINYYLSVELRDATNAPLTSFTSGNLTYSTPNTDAILTTTFSGYSPGLRFIYWEDGGKDFPGWAGHYGPYLRDAYVRVGNCEVPPY